MGRHRGIGSLPSATTTACFARMAELRGGETLVKIALYNPASATTVSRTSIALFMGESPLREFLRVAKYMPNRCSLAPRPVDNCRFFEVRAPARTIGAGVVARWPGRSLGANLTVGDGQVNESRGFGAIRKGCCDAQSIYFSTLLNQTCTTSASTGGCAIQTSQAP